MDRGEEEIGIPKILKAPTSIMAPTRRARAEVFGQLNSRYLADNTIVAEDIELHSLDT